MVILVRPAAFAIGLVAALALLVDPPPPAPASTGPLVLGVALAPHAEAEVIPHGSVLEGELDVGSGEALHATVEVRNRTPADRTWWLAAADGEELHPAVHLRVTGPDGPLLDGRLDELPSARPLRVRAGKSVTLAVSAMRADDVPLAASSDVSVVLELRDELREGSP